MREDFVKATSTAADGGGFGKVEVAFFVGFEAELEFVEVDGEIDVVVEDFKLVGFSVVIEIIRLVDAIATRDVRDVIDDLEAEGFEEAGGVTFPGEFLEVFETGKEPNVAIPSGEERPVAIGEEVDVRHADFSFIGRLVHGRRKGDLIDEPWLVTGGGFSFNFEGLGRDAGAAFGHWSESDRSGDFFSGISGVEKGDLGRFVRGLKAEEVSAVFVGGFDGTIGDGGLQGEALLAGRIEEADSEFLCVRGDFEIANEAVIVIADGIEDAGSIDGVVEDDLVPVAEVSVEIEVGEVAVALERALVFE